MPRLGQDQWGLTGADSRGLVEATPPQLHSAPLCPKLNQRELEEQTAGSDRGRQAARSRTAAQRAFT